jgi:tetratricopeptide (TPR) repeat protein
MTAPLPSSGSPSSLERRIDAAEGYLMLEMPEQALRELRMVEARVGSDDLMLGTIARLRGEAYRLQQDYEEGARQFLVAQSEDSEDLEVSIGLAWCLKRSSRLEEAIDVMMAAYQFHDDEPIVLYNLACYFALASDKVRALSWLGRAIRMEASLTELVADEPDFDGLRHDADFQLIVGERTVESGESGGE